jgi:predicted lipoprotein
MVRMAKRARIAIQQGRLGRMLLALVLCGFAAACARVPGIYTYEGKSQAAQVAAGFNASTYVDGIWQAKVIPTVHSQAVDVETLLAAIDANPDDAAKKYGKTSGVGSPPAFMVKGTGTVTKVDTGSPVGPVTVKLAQKPAPGEVTLLTGPVIAGTALRDAVGFISFGQFPNQIDYADVATQLNNRVKTNVVSKIDRGSLTGKKVTFEGAFELLTPSAISIVPTSLQVAP